MALCRQPQHCLLQALARRLSITPQQRQPCLLIVQTCAPVGFLLGQFQRLGLQPGQQRTDLTGPAQIEQAIGRASTVIGSDGRFRIIEFGLAAPLEVPEFANARASAVFPQGLIIVLQREGRLAFSWHPSFPLRST